MGDAPSVREKLRSIEHSTNKKKIQWVDVSNENSTCPIGLDRETLLKRFHVKELSTGNIRSGASGFARLWCSLPGIWKHLGQFAKLPGVSSVMEFGYLMTLNIRPWLARRIKRNGH